MNDRKTLYLLAGGRGGGSMEPILKAVFKDIGVKSPTIAYVGAANGDDQGFFERMQGVLKQAGKCTLVQAKTAPQDADVRKALEVMKSAEAVFVSGGDVEAGMQVLQEKGITRVFPELYSQGKLFFGVSAGSIMLAKEWVRWTDPDDDSTARLFPCLGVAPVICDTHGEGDDWEELKAAIQLSPEGTTGYGITSSTCLKVQPDGRLSALAGPIAVFARKRGSTVRQPDLVPAK